MGIEFESVKESIRFHNPLQNMEEVEDVIERRRDPLTGRWAIGTSRLKDKAGMFFGASDRELIKAVAEKTRENCFFCPENVYKTTPKYKSEWLSEGRLKQGDALLVPNLFPLAPIHAVIILGERHYRELSEFDAELLYDGLKAAVDFAKIVHRSDEDLKHMTINGNYLFPAGATIVHPHLQLMGGKNAFTEIEKLKSDCDRYRDENRGDYFKELIETEKENNERYVGEKNSVHWVTPFAPMGANEVLGILPECRSLGELKKTGLRGLAEGMSKVLSYYEKRGYSTFNFTVYSDSMHTKDASSFPVFVRMITRQNVYENYRADDYFIQKLLGVELMLTSPEETAEGLILASEN